MSRLRRFKALFDTPDPVDAMLAWIIGISIAVSLIAIILALSSCSQPLPEVRFPQRTPEPGPTAAVLYETDPTLVPTSGSIEEALYIEGRHCGWIRTHRDGSIEWEPCEAVRASIARGIR